MFWILFQRMETCFEEEEEQVTAGSPSPRREEPDVEGEDCGGALTFNSSTSSSPLCLCVSRIGYNHAETRRARWREERERWANGWSPAFHRSFVTS